MRSLGIGEQMSGNESNITPIRPGIEIPQQPTVSPYILAKLDDIAKGQIAFAQNELGQMLICWGIESAIETKRNVLKTAGYDLSIVELKPVLLVDESEKEPK